MMNKLFRKFFTTRNFAIRRPIQIIENSDSVSDRSKIKEEKILAYNKVREFFTTRNFAIRRQVDEFSTLLSLLPTDTQCFLNVVYKMSTRVKKVQVDVAEYGRSMVEMLGVLAIIGILSVGGVAGYQKAMMKYRLNELSKSINQLFFDFLTIQDKLDIPNNSWIDHAQMMNNLGMTPNNAVLKGNMFRFPDLGLNIRPYTDKRLTNGKGTSHFGFYFYLGTAENDAYSVEICKTIFQVAQHYYSEVKSGFSYNGERYYFFQGKQNCHKDSGCLINLTVDELMKICRVDEHKPYNIHIAFPIK